MFCVVLFAGANMQRKIENMNQHKMIVYDTRGSSFISFVDGQNALNIRDMENKDNDFKFNTKNNFIKLGIKNNKNISVYDDFAKQSIVKSYKNIIYFDTKTVKIVTDNETFLYQNPLSINYLIVNKHSGNNFQQVFNNYNPDMLIIDSSVALRQARNWMREAENKNIKYHYVREKGAFVSE
jgi:hypothetical protein